jgi:hypothetical protein
MAIDRARLVAMGIASAADAVLFPDPTVFALAGVNPMDAVVLVDRSPGTPSGGELVLFTRDGISPPLALGVCAYYREPQEAGCPP